MTHSDAEKSVRDGSYRFATDHELREMWDSCMSIGALNPNATDRIRRIAEIIWKELSDREGTRSAFSITSHPLPNSVEYSFSSEKEWNQARLEALIRDRVEENLNLEYKAAAALKDSTNEITKDISAFANSDGGIIIFGIAEDPAARHLPGQLDPVSRTSCSKERLEHLAALIRPRIIGLRIHAVTLSSGQNDVVYVVEVPKGTTAHQGTSCKYYRRHNFESVAMIDHEVKDVMNRHTSPVLSVSASLMTFHHPRSNGADGAFVLHLENQSDVFARYVLATLLVPIKVRENPVIYIGSPSIVHTETGAAYKIRFSNHLSTPMFPRGSLDHSFEFRFVENLVPEPEKYLSEIHYTVYADAMIPLKGSFQPERITRDNK